MTDRILLGEIKENRSPSVQYILFDRNRILNRFSSGFANIEDRKETDSKTTYNGYSVTKTFTALAILQLAQGNKLGLDDSIKKYLPDIPYNSRITVKHLLSHSSGIPNPIPLNWIHLYNTGKTFDTDTFFENIITKHNKTKSLPNEKYAYSNLGYVLLGKIIEKASGIKYEEYIKNNIITPLGISNTEMGFEIPDPLNHAVGYHKKLSFSNLLLGFFIDKPEYMTRGGQVWKPFKLFYVNGPSYGGIIATPDSFIGYIRELLSPDCRLISSDFRKLLFTENFTLDNKPTGMCLAWFKGQLCGHTYFTHAGGGGGYYCEIRIYPDLGLGSSVFFNRTGMSDQRFLDRVDSIYLKNRESS